MGFYRHIACAVLLTDKTADAFHGFCRQMDGVRTHISDETHRLLAPADGNAFVQLLGHEHGPARRKVQMLDGFLLETARRKRSIRPAHAVLDTAVRDAVGRSLEICRDLSRLFPIMDTQLLTVFFDDVSRKFG